MLTKLVVNGRTLDLANIRQGQITTFVSAQNDYFGGEIGATAYSRFGMVYDDKNDAEQDYVFYQGIKTAKDNMPTTGQMKYSGLALYDCGGCRNKRSTSEFNVDFGAKTIKGEITGSPDIKGGKVILEAKINGSDFAGTTDKGVQTNGAFFGDNAQEMSGVYKGADFIGAFGATKTN